MAVFSEPIRFTGNVEDGTGTISLAVNDTMVTVKSMSKREVQQLYAELDLFLKTQDEEEE